MDDTDINAMKFEAAKTMKLIGTVKRYLVGNLALSQQVDEPSIPTFTASILSSVLCHL